MSGGHDRIGKSRWRLATPYLAGLEKGPSQTSLFEQLKSVGLKQQIQARLK